MNYYLAPMEGITGYTYRNVYRKYFVEADKYFTPFISTHEKLGNKEKRELDPQNNIGINLIPQIMIGSVREELQLEKLITPYGYDELNINAGCPSGTVANKARGAGLLRDTDYLDELFENLFDNCTCKLSLKTRLGWSDVSEWEEIAKIIGRYPFREVIIHTRVREEFYRGKAHDEAMDIAGEYIKVPKCYNGDIYTVEDARNIQDKYPWLDAIMIGRGILQNPALIDELKGQDLSTRSERILEFMEDMFETYLVLFNSEINTLFHMKELWGYLGNSYPGHEKELKTIRKTRNITEYKLAVRRILLDK